jgi:outer membrane translocation and assembly module TamA
MIVASEALSERLRSHSEMAMHLLVKSLVVSLLASAGLAQQCVVGAADCVRIGRLAIESKGLPDPERERIIRLFQQKTYFQEEIGERIRGALRDLGYFKAVVDAPKFSFPAQGEGRTTAYVTVKAEPGAQYRLGEIRFERVSIFPAAQLRDLFLMRRGDLFDITKVSRGLDELRKLYGTRGYVNCVVNPAPRMDESLRTIDLVLDVDEGKPFDFGKLYLEGVEPYPGAGKELMNSWKTLEGKRYNPLELQHWLLANHFDWKVATQTSDSIRLAGDPDTHVVNVKLTQWPN